MGGCCCGDMGGGDSSVGGSSRVSSGFGGALVRAGGPGWVGRPGWAAGHPFAAAGGGMMGCAVHWPVGSITKGRPRHDGGHDLPRPAPTRERPGMVFMPPSAGVLRRARDRRAGRRRRTPAGAGPRRHCRCCGRGGRRPAPAAPPAGVVAVMVLTDSIAAQRTSREPCLVIRPRGWALRSRAGNPDLPGWTSTKLAVRPLSQ